MLSRPISVDELRRKKADEVICVIREENEPCTVDFETICAINEVKNEAGAEVRQLEYTLFRILKMLDIA